ncbi:MAG TPA: cyclophilin-like fold protein [Thermodesulfobacteriota bacterium]|nr:cyclophilin-like fold protein [Thermodesulfobacteriota bacterium]
MGKKIRILLSDLKVEAELTEGKTAQLIWEALPIAGKANLWGEEIYFAIPVKTGLETGSREVVSAGELGYWPTGHAFCIFFGPTPASKGDEIRAASAVNIVGKVLSDPKVFLKVKDGAKVTLEKCQG